jgi:hypothetical protein
MRMSWLNRRCACAAQQRSRNDMTGETVAAVANPNRRFRPAPFQWDTRTHRVFAAQLHPCSNRVDPTCPCGSVDECGTDRRMGENMNGDRPPAALCGARHPGASTTPRSGKADTLASFQRWFPVLPDATEQEITAFGSSGLCGDTRGPRQAVPEGGRGYPQLARSETRCLVGHSTHS